MTAAIVREAIVCDRLLVIVRLVEADAAVAAARAVAEGGCRAIEFSLSSPAALPALRRVSDSPGELIAGAGTVLTLEQAQAAHAAGARFMLSPVLSESIMHWATEHDLLYIPGAFTPSEVAGAVAAGAGVVKLFPAGVVGPGYVRDLLGPFPELALLATGGIGAANAQAFLDAGAAAVAVGSALVNERSASDPHRWRPQLGAYGR